MTDAQREAAAVLVAAAQQTVTETCRDHGILSGSTVVAEAQGFRSGVLQALAVFGLTYSDELPWLQQGDRQAEATN